MTADMETSIRASRRRVARSRGALSGILLVILGLWAALVPFIGPYFNLAFTPSPNSAWHWTAARGWLEVLPGAAAFVGGLLLLASSSRAMTMFGGWLAALAGAWLVIGPSLADPMNLNAGRPDPSLGTDNRALAALLFFYAIGAAIVFFASLALGRVSVLSVRDVRAAERRAEAEEAERQAALEAAAREQEAARERELADRRDGVEGPVPADGRVDERTDGRSDGVRDGEHAGRHSGQPAATTNLPPADGTQHQPVPQYADGRPPAGGPAGAQYPQGQYPQGQYPPPANPGGQYPSAPPPRE